MITREEREEYIYRIEKYRLHSLGASEDETTRIMAMGERERQRTLADMEKEYKTKQYRDIRNARRRDVRAERNAQRKYFDAIAKGIEEKAQARNESIKASKKTYKDKNCASLQVFLEKDLVHEFKSLVKNNGDTQADILRNFIAVYIANSKDQK